MRSDSWKEYEQAAEYGPWRIIVKVGSLMVGIMVLFLLVGYSLGWFGEAAKVAKEEFGPTAALQKYEWFIEQANRIEKMDKDVSMFELRLAKIEDQYEAYGSDKSKWPPDIRVQYNREYQQGREDLLAVASQRNNLVRDYNAASEKFNWKPFETKAGKPKERFHDYETR